MLRAARERALAARQLQKEGAEGPSEEDRVAALETAQAAALETAEVAWTAFESSATTFAVRSPLFEAAVD